MARRLNTCNYAVYFTKYEVSAKCYMASSTDNQATVVEADI